MPAVRCPTVLRLGRCCRWYDELQANCKGIPTIVVANKIDIDYKVS